MYETFYTLVVKYRRLIKAYVAVYHVTFYYFAIFIACKSQISNIIQIKYK